MKNLIIASMSMFLIGSVLAQESTMNYSLDTQKVIQKLKEEEGYKKFCTDYLFKINENDKIGKEIIKSTCVSDFFNYNVINEWGNEIYMLSMDNNKKPPALYPYLLPVGKLDKELVLASTTLLSNIFWTSIDRYNVKVKSVPEKENITKDQYVFFNDIYIKLKDKSGKNLKPVMSKVFDVNGYNIKVLRSSPTFINYTESLIESKKIKERIFENMDIMMNSFNSYKSYLDFVYSKKMDEVVSSPGKFNGYKFNKVQCSAFKLALSINDYENLKKEANFICE